MASSEGRKLKAWQSKLARALGDCRSEQESERAIERVCAFYTVDRGEVLRFLAAFAQAFEMAREARA